LRLRRWLAAAVLAAGSFACGTPDTEPIVIGSANFTESIVLAEIYAQALEAGGFEVTKKLNIGAREVYFPALESGSLDFLPEYTSSLVRFVTKKDSSGVADAEKTYNNLSAALKGKGITALDMAEDAEDKDVIVTNAPTADTYDLEKVSDLKEHASELVMGGPPECKTRQACLKGLEDVYGIEFKEFKSLDANATPAVELLKANEIQVANMYTTDGRIRANNFVELEDDMGIVGAENIVPVVRNEVLDEHGDEFEGIVNAITAKLTTADLIELNGKVDNDKLDADDVAGAWLRENDLL
jgi:osmoprotectant transport system substrate-binding protein